jgi:hypothetical protein
MNYQVPPEAPVVPEMELAAVAFRASPPETVRPYSKGVAGFKVTDFTVLEEPKTLP